MCVARAHLQALLIHTDYHPGLLTVDLQPSTQGPLLLLGLPVLPDRVEWRGQEGHPRPGPCVGEGEAGASVRRPHVMEEGEFCREHAVHGVQDAWKNRDPTVSRSLFRKGKAELRSDSD